MARGNFFNLKMMMGLFGVLGHCKNIIFSSKDWSSKRIMVFQLWLLILAPAVGLLIDQTDDDLLDMFQLDLQDGLLEKVLFCL